MNFELRTTDVLIIGAGAAGLRTAIELADQGVDCMVVSKRERSDAHTALAAGGINAALGTRDPDDDWTVHAADTLREGHFIAQPMAVELLARHASDRIRELADWGCPFDRTAAGKIEQRYFGAHAYRRTCFVGDATGRAILDTLVERAHQLGVSIGENIHVTEILVDDGGAQGVIGWDRSSGQAKAFGARAVVLAAGGCTGLYRRHSSRHDENTGDATGLAWAAGAELCDMEFIQFHPTGMVGPEEMQGMLVTEAVRGEGGRLFNAQGDRFMTEYAPDEMELAPRDVVARAIAHEIDASRGTGAGGVLLDISHRDADFIRRRLPRMVERFESLGIDISAEPMEVAPTAHYAMGGVQVDFETGATSVDGLFAVGEATAGVHGANRLGGNSLAETVVFGQLTGAYLADWVIDRRAPSLQDAYIGEKLSHWADYSRQTGAVRPEELIEGLRQLLEGYAGIARSEQRLQDGLESLAVLREQAQNCRVYTTPGSVVFEKVCNLPFMLDTAEMILRSAQMRRESRGAHYRRDYEDSDPDWQVSIVCRHGEDDEIALEAEAIDEPSDEVRRAIERNLHLDYHHLE